MRGNPSFRRRFTPGAQKTVPLDLATLREALFQEIRESSVPAFLTPLEVRPLDVPGLFDVAFQPEAVGDVYGRALHLGEDFLEGDARDEQGAWTGGRTRLLDFENGSLVLEVPGDARPRINRRIVLKPVDFLKALSTWAKELGEIPPLFELAATTAGLLGHALGPPVPGLPPASGLRPSQLAALARAGGKIHMIWGPPGTGKTYTLGAAVAGHLAAGRTVLAISTTNRAVDLLVLAIDDACSRLGRAPEPGEIVRAGRPQMEELLRGPERAHLLRWTEILDRFAREESDLRARLAETKLGQQQSDLSEAGRTMLRTTEAQLADCLRQLEEMRRVELAKLAQGARCVGATFSTFVASISLHRLPFDIVVVDEASMVPAAAICRLMQDDRPGFLLGGDFMQLPPICRAGDTFPQAHAWLGRSFFDLHRLHEPKVQKQFLASGALSLLTEQSRMVPAICEAVSQSFYGGLLTVEKDPGPLNPPPPWPAAPLVVVNPHTAPLLPDAGPTTDEPHKPFHGRSLVWDRSAQVARALVTWLVDSFPPGIRILVLSPYRAQANLLKTLCGALDPVRVSTGTVHSAQGSEADLVIFDPVDPSSWFVNKSLHAANLINVALSRGRRQLVLLGNPEALLGNRNLQRFIRKAALWCPPQEIVHAGPGRGFRSGWAG